MTDTVQKPGPQQQHPTAGGSGIDIPINSVPGGIALDSPTPAGTGIGRQPHDRPSAPMVVPPAPADTTSQVGTITKWK